MHWAVQWTTSRSHILHICWSRSEAKKHAVELNKSCKQLAKTSGITFPVAYISSQARLNQKTKTMPLAAWPILSHVDRHLTVFSSAFSFLSESLAMPFPTFLLHWQQVAMKVSCFLSTTMSYLFFTIDSSTSFSTSDSSTFFSPANLFFHIFSVLLHLWLQETCSLRPLASGAEAGTDAGGSAKAGAHRTICMP